MSEFLLTCTTRFGLISSPSVPITMSPKRLVSKEMIESSINEVVEIPPVIFPILSNTELFIEKGLSHHMVHGQILIHNYII